MKRFLRFLFHIPQPKISREEAIHIAENHFGKKGTKISHMGIVEELRSWLIWENADLIPSRWIRIDNQKGDIKDSGKPLR